MLDDEGVNLMPGEEAIRAAVGIWPQHCRERWWGPRLAAVRVSLASIPAGVLDELVVDAWASKAPKALTRSYLER
jgi:sRNA-binding protein